VRYKCFTAGVVSVGSDSIHSECRDTIESVGVNPTAAVDATLTMIACSGR